MFVARELIFFSAGKGGTQFLRWLTIQLGQMVGSI